jgi:hypothetical protein
MDDKFAANWKNIFGSVFLQTNNQPISFGFSVPWIPHSNTT